MNKTIFFSGRNKAIIIKSASGGNQKACDAILAELIRLQNRIKELEAGEDSENYIIPDEVEI